MLTLLRFFKWLFQKAAVGVTIVVLAVVVGAGWLYLRQNLDFEQWRQDTRRAITGERTRYESALNDVKRELDRISDEIAAEQKKQQLAERVIATLQGIDSTWDKVFGDREQQKKNTARLADVTAQREAIVAKIATLQENYTRKTWERDGLQVAIGKVDLKLRAVEEQRSKLVAKISYYVHATLNYEVGRGWFRFTIQTWVFILVGLYLFGPTIKKILCYFVLAPWVVRGRPVRLAERADVLPLVSESHVALELDLAAGERLRIKEKFLQASDEGLRRKTRFLLDWRIPFTCIAAGLVELIEMANPATSGGAQRLTLSNQNDPHSELALVTLPEGGSIILRPSFLAGVVTPDDHPLRIRRRWQMWRWQAWLTLQFRFFEFVGPCKLVVAGSRGVRAENLADREGPVVPARRTNQDATVGFTPNLDYRPVRAETFWSYYRGMNPLFDDLFAGRGVFLCQQVAGEGEAKRARKFWSSVWAGLTKLFGL